MDSFKLKTVLSSDGKEYNCTKSDHRFAKREI